MGSRETGVDFGRHSADYGDWRPGLPLSFCNRLKESLGFDGKDVLDLGTGPGTVALELASKGARVTGIDLSDEQIREARQRAEKSGVIAQCTFEVLHAEQTGLQDGSFDIMVASQCWWWFDHGRAQAEVTRLLRPGGHLIVCSFNYLARQNEIARRTESLILKHNPGWMMAGNTGISAHWIDDLQSPELRLVEQFSYDHLQPFTHEGWRGRIRTCNGVGSGGMDAATVRRFDEELRQMLAAEYGNDTVFIEHRVWCVIVKKTERST